MPDIPGNACIVDTLNHYKDESDRVTVHANYLSVLLHATRNFDTRLAADALGSVGPTSNADEVARLNASVAWYLEQNAELINATERLSRELQDARDAIARIVTYGPCAPASVPRGRELEEGEEL